VERARQVATVVGGVAALAQQELLRLGAGRLHPPGRFLGGFQQAQEGQGMPPRGEIRPGQGVHDRHQRLVIPAAERRLRCAEQVADLHVQRVQVGAVIAGVGPAGGHRRPATLRGGGRRPRVAVRQVVNPVVDGLPLIALQAIGQTAPLKRHQRGLDFPNRAAHAAGQQIGRGAGREHRPEGQEHLPHVVLQGQQAGGHQLADAGPPLFGEVLRHGQAVRGVGQAAHQLGRPDLVDLERLARHFQGEGVVAELVA